MIKFIKIIDFKCKTCGNEEYEAIDIERGICICSKCGKQVKEEDGFKIEIEEVEE